MNAGASSICKLQGHLGWAQVFVANPNKTRAIIDILAGNKDKLLRYLKDFHNDTSKPFHASFPLLPPSFLSSAPLVHTIVGSVAICQAAITLVTIQVSAMTSTDD